MIADVEAPTSGALCRVENEGRAQAAQPTMVSTPKAMPPPPPSHRFARSCHGSLWTNIGGPPTAILGGAFVGEITEPASAEPRPQPTNFRQLPTHSCLQ